MPRSTQGTSGESKICPDIIPIPTDPICTWNIGTLTWGIPNLETKFWSLVERTYLGIGRLIISWFGYSRPCWEKNIQTKTLLRWNEAKGIMDFRKFANITLYSIYKYIFQYSDPQKKTYISVVIFIKNPPTTVPFCCSQTCRSSSSSSRTSPSCQRWPSPGEPFKKGPKTQ